MEERGVRFLRKLRFYEVLLIVLVLLFFSTWATLEVTETAVFCGNTCHVMRHYYQDWKESSHNNVPCVQCHTQPDEDGHLAPRFRALVQLGSYFTRTYGERTRAEVLDANCLQKECHSSRLLEGRVTFKKGILFDHKPHMQKLSRGKILRCTTCHSHIAMGDHMTVAESACFICHFKGFEDNPPTARCTLCHAPPDSPVEYAGGRLDHSDFMEKSVDCRYCHLNIVQGTGEVLYENCANCHRRTDRITASETAETLHRQHVTDHKVECSDCHSVIRHQLPEQRVVFKNSCSLCHSRGHRAIMSLYSGEGVNGVEPDPSPMYLAGVECVACHGSSDGENPGLDSAASSMKANRQRCELCHERDHGDLLLSWSSELARSMARMQAKISLADKGISSAAPSDLKDEASRLVAESKNSLFFIEAGIPVHNYGYAMKALDKVSSDLDNAILLTRQVRNGI